MATKIATTVITANTVPGSQKLEIEGFGTPTLAIVSCVADDGGGPAFGFGATDGVRQRGISANSTTGNSAESVLATSRASNFSLLFCIDNSGNPVFEGTFVGWSENGITVAWSNPPPPPGTKINLQLFSGMQAYVDHMKSPNIKNIPTNYGSASFTPKGILLFGAGSVFDGDAVFTDSRLCFGAVDYALHNFATLAILKAGDSGDAATIGKTGFSNTRCLLNDTALFGGSSVEITAFTSSGFTAVTRGVNGTGYAGYILFSEELFSKEITSPIETGLIKEKIPNCSPLGGFILEGRSQAVGIFSTAADAAISLFAKDTLATTGLSQRVGSEDSQAFKSQADSLQVFSSDGSLLIRGDLLATVNQELAIDYTTVAATEAYKWLILSFARPVGHFRKICNTCRTFLGLTAVYPNAPDLGQSTYVEILFQNSTQRGVAGRFGTSGSIRVKLIGAIEAGDKALLEQADALYLQFLNQTSGIVAFRPATVMRLGQIDGVYEVDVDIPFLAQEDISKPSSAWATGLETTYDVASIIRTRFATLFPTVGVIYDNQPVEAPLEDTWIHVQVLPGTAQQVQLNTRRIQGRVNFGVFTPIERGDLDILVILDEIADQFRNVSISGVVFRTPSIVASRRDRGYWRMDLSCPYYFEEITSV